ncbi:putative Ferrichrome siderophore peptide synthetase [Ustilago hordei]|uniref:Probable ferrichrome siderophore peptide synthetase n=1 Tax=Ustilago hordei TaxID=120017 RepID=I2FRS4_USTHO|nr:putative Ferrichrome siderophore peptide synthetase [Ustilago hordei]CCF49617.1 probable ferrichrome siderophore peptide synthetase [Ustilago hordei]SYW87082.1 probable Ferrichrome siderophore peptide synthetase [Ustilago hordei]
MATTKTSHAPFPDVAGLRTSGPDFSRVGQHCKLLRVEETLELDADAASSFANKDLDLAVLSALCVILFHYGSHEATNVQVLHTLQDGHEIVVQLDFAEQRELADFEPPQLAKLVDSARQRSIQAQNLDHGYAAFYAPTKNHAPSSEFDKLQFDVRPEISLALSYHLRDSKHLLLQIKAAPAVHSEQSAQLQVRQVAALLRSFHHDTKMHALSVERFDWKLRASDNSNYVHLPDPENLHDRHADRLETEFEYFADNTPEALALDFRFDLKDQKSTKWTYAQMNERAEKVKQLLWSHGIGSASSCPQVDHIVALYLEKSPETYLSFIGVLKAGAAWCPIDTDWPPSRRQALLAKSNASIVLTHDDKISKQLEQDLQSGHVKSKGGIKAIRLDQLDAELQNVNAIPNDAIPNDAIPNAEGARSIQQLAYMIWTSGTTGLPKGVGIQHLAIIQAMRSLRLYIPYGKAKIGTDQIRYLQYSAYNFDLSIMDCFYTWGLGGTICSCPRGVLLQDLVEVCNSIQPTHTLLTPAVMAMTERHRVPSLKVVISGGEKLSQVVADEWSKDCCLLNLYGPAEATLIAMNRRVPYRDRVKAPNIGVALPTVSCHALDKHDRVVIKGAVGELVLGGPQLARGYVGDPLKTAEKFFPHPQLGRVYRTGDLVRQLDNQEFEYLGRIDDQVKVNGIRIELLEINAAIKNSHDKIKDSETMAFPKKGNESEQQIINFSALPGGQPGELLRTDDEAVPVARALQANAKKNLPSYMVPNLFVILSHFPRTSSAKIDRIALKNVLANFDQLDWENKLANQGDDDDIDPASAEAEACLRKWLAKLCNVDANKIGRKTPFTSVGLDSIRAMTFSQRVSQEFYSVSVLDVARFPTLKALGEHLRSSSGSGQKREQQAAHFLAEWDAAFRPAVSSWLRQRGSTVENADIQKILPCTPLQEGMLAESQRDTSSYRIQRQYQLPLDCDDQRLRQALFKTVEHFDSLRTSFADAGSLDIDSKGQQWPFQPHFLQLVWKSFTPKIEHLKIADDVNAEHAILSTVKSKLQLDPFAVVPPVAFLLVEQGKKRSLVLVAHHSTYDARSLGIFEDYVEAYYQGAAPPPSSQFSTALAQILPIDEKEMKRHAEVWSKALSSYPKGEAAPFPILSLTKASDVDAEEANLHQSRYMEANVRWADIETVCRRLGVSARPMVQTAWAMVLSSYLESPHLILGDSVSGRTLSADLDQVYGPVLSTVPVPFVLRPKQKLSDLIREMNAFHTSVMEAQHTDLGAIRRLLQVPPGEHLFHSVFVLEPAPSQPEQVDQKHFRLTKLADLGVATEHVLGVEVLPGSDGCVKLGLSWQKSFVSEAFGSLMLEQFNRSLAALCASCDVNVQSFLREGTYPDQETSSLYSVTKMIEQAQLRKTLFAGVSSSLNKEAISENRCAVEVYQDIADAASRRKPAATISYAELEHASNGVASLLGHLPRNSVVGVCLKRSLESYIAPLAILKAGHAYLPLDATLPVDRKKELLKDSAAAVLISSSQEPELHSIADVQNLDVNSVSFQDAAKKIDATVTVETGPDDVAFIIYTSGSTGKPKGCLLTQANLAAAIEGFHITYEREAPGSFQSPARFLARSAEAFDVHLLEMFLSLRVGATIVTGPRALIHDDIAKTMSTLEVTHACVVPSLFFSNGQRVKPSAVPSLRALIIGGEALTLDLCQLWGSEGAERPVVLNAYGPSEATIGNSIARVSKRSRPSNIGAPFHGTQYLVLKEVDRRLVPTLRGEPGELCIGGDQVGKGYLNRPEASSFTEYQGQWIYRTGDMVRLHPNDKADYLGRMDGSQVKVRGARLELGEVDAALTACLNQDLGQTGSAVTIHVDHPKIEGPARLVSFFAREGARTEEEDACDPAKLLLQSSDTATRAAELRKRVRVRLPQYMVPSIVLPLVYLPISSLSGKADRRLLKDLYHSIDLSQLANASATDGTQKRELTSNENTVADTVRATIRLVSDVELTHDLDLIMAGLDSLTVVTLASKLRKLNFDVSVSSIMNEPSIEAIARRRSSKDGTSVRDAALDWERKVSELTAKAAALPQYSQTQIEKVLPCVPIQTALISQAISEDRGTPRYITTITVNIARGHFTTEQIRSAWMDTLARHPIYRTIFAEIDRALVQVVLSPEALASSWSLAAEELPPAKELEMYHSRTAREIAATLDSQPALRIRLWNSKGLAPSLTLTCSHAIYDGESIRMLLKEASDRLQGQLKEEPATPFAVATRAIVGDAREEATKKFWRETLAGFSITQVPNLTGVRPENRPSKSEELTIISSQSYSKLEVVARSSKVTVQSILIAVFAHLLGLYVGDDEVTLGLVLSGRSIPVGNVKTIHGPCVTTVPFRLYEARKPLSLDLCVRAHHVVNALLPYQHVSLPQLMRWLDLSRSPFEALFSYLGRATSSSEPLLFSEGATRMERDYPLALEVSATDDDVSLHLAFDSRLIPVEQAKLMLSQYDSVLTSFTGVKQSPSIEAELLSILNKDCYVPASPSESFVARFTEHASKTPGASAIAFTLSMRETPKITTYAELDSLSSTIAHRLADKPGQFVGVHLNKDGPELYATILAIWKAGKAYLPLDPALPAERLSYMIESVSDCPVIASQSTRANLATFHCEVLDLADLAKTCTNAFELPKPSLDAPCYLLFTSGSTGKPKAVQINQRALAGALYSWERILPFTQQSRFLQLASIGFDVCLIEMCMPLSLGFSIGTAPKQELLEDLTHSIKHLGITIADLPAALAGTVHPDDVQLEWLMSGGDVIDARVVDEWNQAGRILINAWGPTEATIGNTLGQIKTGATRNLIGRVYPTSSMYVLEEGSTRVLPSGAIGELVVGGPQVADCYHGRDDLTAEKFIYLEDGSRVYRTGDLGRFLHDETVECLGRIGSDRQVKVNGQRMELDEVSSVLSAQTGVHDVDVQYLKHPSMGMKQLVAFVAAADLRAKGDALKPREDEAAIELCNRLEQEAAKRLAAYMVPTHWIVTNRGLPLTHNNKTDHKALSQFYERLDASLLRSLGAMREGAISSQAWTESEKELRKLIARFSDVPEDQIARTTSFHRLGIDSISAIRLVKELCALGYTFTVADVLSTPNIAALAEKEKETPPAHKTQADFDLKEWIRETTAIAQKAGWRLSDADSIESILPCTPLQSGMIAQSLASSGRLYFHHHAFEVSKVTVDKASSAWKKLVERLDILRATFHAVEGEHPWAQAVHSLVEPRVIKHKGSFSSPDLNALDGQPSFEDEEAFRVAPHVLHLWPKSNEKGDSTIMLSIHHALYDGTSLPQLLEDFEALIAGNEQQLITRLPFCKLAPALLSRDKDVRYWTDALQGLQPTLLAAASTHGAAVLIEKEIALTAQELEIQCRSIGVSPQVLCNLAFGKLLALESGTRDVCFGQLFGLLDLMPEADTAVGPAFNTVATRIRFADLEKPAKQVAVALQLANDAGRPHRRAALRDVQAKLHRGQLFDALFDYQRAYDQADNSRLRALDLPDSGEESAQYTLNVAFVQGPSKMSIVAKADSQRYDAQRLAAVVDRLEELLKHLSSHVDASVSALPESCSDTAFPTYLPEGTSAVNGSTHANGKPSTNGDAQLSEEGRQLAAIISKVSGVVESELQGDSRLSTLGLDSISAIRIASQARKAGIDLRMGEIVAGETINGILARRSQANGAGSGTAGKANVRPNGHANGNSHVNRVSTVSPVLAQQVAVQLGVEADRIERVLPILAGQKLWLATWTQSKAGRGEGGYSFAYRLPGVNAAKAKSTWEKLRQLQPILRTTFLLSQDGSAVQVVLKAESSPEQTHFSEVSVENSDVEAAAIAVVARHAADGWPDLSRPPVQLTLVGDILVFSLHHVLYDAFSIEMLVHDFGLLHHGSNPTSSNKWVQAVEHIADEQQQIRADAERYWSQSLSTASSGLLPAVATATDAVEAFHAERKAISVSPETDAKMRKAGLTLPAIVLAAWSTLLSERLNTSVASSPVFGLYQLGRSAAVDGIEKVQGPLLNMLPIKIEGVSVLDKARAATKELRLRGLYEQTDLVDVHRWAGLSTYKPSYNTFVNLLITSKEADDGEEAVDAMQPVDLGHPFSYATKDDQVQKGIEIQTKATVVKTHAAIWQPDVNVDVVLGGNDGVDIAIKAKIAVIGEAELPSVVRRLANLVHKALSQL